MTSLSILGTLKMASDLDIVVPDCYKQVRPYILIAKEHDSRDPIVAYYARRYAMETAMKLKQQRTPEGKTFLFGLMDVLEKCKTKLQEAGNDEAVTSDVVGSVHVENYALKIFLFADNEDRAAKFTKSTIKSFYKAGLLLDIMQTFGELSEELANNRKYAKWKATYINNCLKKGVTPIAGPVDEEGEGGGAPVYSQPPNTPSGGVAPLPGAYPPPQQPGPSYPPQAPSTSYPPSASNLMPPGAHAPPTTPEQYSVGQTGIPGPSTQPPSSGGVQLSVSDYSKAQKFCKYAGSALQYEDVPTAIENLEKALRLLRTGKE
ncbi:vacuolar protein sorting-associated protein VTA1 homolog isoform X2 [Anneissia japonica]|uniref:vacuolar protein sorting-associated protein VTA1 homolog isoform X2 n=1 Tax=Anneissia japonica TaxID=1529436 RepID=UPI0014255844|nr:vacuolar protein sorting-associated protein VTA1 homolog isoform X2 [Anneissia japonica]